MPPAAADAHLADLDPDDIFDLHSEDDPADAFADDLTADRGQLESTSDPNKLTWTDASPPPWNADPNYRHLGQDIDRSPFPCSAGTLERLARLNHFDAALDREDTVIVGLRGCQLADGADDSGGPILVARLREAPLDYVHHHCLLGIWKRDIDSVAWFRANTLPMWFYLRKAIIERSRDSNVGGGASLLMPGLYRYVVGPHTWSGRKYPDALRIDPAESYVVWRPAPDRREIRLETTDTVWKPGNYGHNIHPSSGRGDDDPSHYFHFSAGCQTLPGTIVGKRNEGVWQSFRDVLGLPRDSTTGHQGDPYPYMLLTGREARLASTGDADNLARIRHGSTGPQVKAARAALGLAPTARADGQLIRALAVRRWQDKGGSADPVITPDDADVLGISLQPDPGVA